MNTPISLSVKNVRWSTPRSNQTILQPVSFDLEAGKVLGIVGPNGSGKSTLLRLLYRYYKPSSGMVLLDGNDIWSQSAQDIACRVAAVLQEHPSDFALTVGQIVALGRTPHRKWFGSANGENDNQIIEFSLKRLKLYDFIERPLSTLSGGEKQRVMVARALAQEPRLLVLDEPTNHLDVRQQLEIVSLIRDLPITIVTSLHDLNMAADTCDEILILKNGETLGFGKPKNILSEDIISKAFDVGVKRQLLSSSKSAHITFHL